MKKLKVFFDKYKGYVLAGALTLLTVIEYCGGFINNLCGGVLVIGGVEVLPIATSVATLIVGIISNGYTKEQKAAIKALLNSTKTADETNATVKAQLKVKLKETEAALKELNTNKATLEAKLKSLNAELTTAKSNYDAKVKMFNMQPQLATNAEVNEARAGVTTLEGSINSTKAELDKCNALITSTTTMINAIKSQL